MPYAENYKGGDRTAGNTIMIQPMLWDFSEEIIGGLHYCSRKRD